MASVSPTQRSLKFLRESGWRCEVVEYWQAHARKRKDLWNIVDILCLRDGEILGVQVTSASNVSARVKKITECEALDDIRKASIRLEVHGWAKGRDGKYKLRIVDCS